MKRKVFGYYTIMIYYVEDDTNIRDLAVYALRQAGFEACGFSCASDFFAALKKQIPELALLDIMLPETDGLEILRQLRCDPATKFLPVMMLTAKGTEYDTVCGLDAGADDYLSKPFGMMELVSRVNALLRRAGEPAACLQGVISCDGIALSAAAHTVTAVDKPVVLTLKEFDLLKTLMQHEGQVLTRDQLLEDVWGITYAGGTRTVDVHVQTLRQKLAAVHPGVDRCIHTVRGVGYSIKSQSA
ncbi:MAG: response regulator transcription factor [Raoultibacter sp.]